MLGWQITIHRTIPPLTGLDDPRLADVVAASAGRAVGDTVALGTRLEVSDWRASLGGLDWLHELVDAEEAVQLLHSGYPSLYAFSAESARELDAREVELWPPGLGHVVVTVQLRQILSTRDEWLVAIVWDQS